MTHQLVWFADKIDTDQHTSTSTEIKMDTIESSKQEEEEKAETISIDHVISNTPDCADISTAYDRLSLISEMSMADSISSQTVEHMDEQKAIEDIDVLTVRSIGVIEEINHNDIKELIQKCTHREPFKSPKVHSRRSDRKSHASRKRNTGWFSLLGRAY